MIYEPPIHETVGTLQTMMANEHDRVLIKAVQQVGIEIDQESLIEALHSDRKRYEEAYKRGYADCQEHYRQLLSQISKLAATGGEQE